MKLDKSGQEDEKIQSFKLLISILFILFFCIFTACFPLSAQTWIEDTAKDFSNGTFDDAGQNIYVTSKGIIKTIHKFDINSDGYIDLLFNSTHNDYAFIPATLSYISKNKTIQSETIAVEGSKMSAFEDFNNDGWPDIAFCPNRSGVQHARRFVSIAWGSKDGWLPQHISGVLPVHYPHDLRIADLNADGLSDIVVRCGKPWLTSQEGNSNDRIVRVFWGRKEGFGLHYYQDFTIPWSISSTTNYFTGSKFKEYAVLTKDGSIIILRSGKKTEKRIVSQKVIKLSEEKLKCITSADINKDGYIDFVVGTGNNIIYIVFGDKEQRYNNTIEIKGANASHIAVGDIDKDGFMDLSLSYFKQVVAEGGELTGGSNRAGSYVQILWGNQGGFSIENRTKLSVPYNVSSTVYDFDQDGKNDLLCVVHQGEKVYKTESPIFYATGKREFVKGKKGIPSEGAYYAEVVPSNENSSTAVIISNSKGGNLREEVPVLLYWGSKEGFSSKNHLPLSFRSGYEGTAADFNDDGYVDLLIIDEMHGGQTAAEDPWHGINIFWGSKKGINLKNRSVLNEEYAGTSNVADLNKDGYLDLVIGFFGPHNKEKTNIVIYYGSKQGYSKALRKSITCDGRSNSPVIADFNKDGWLDIASASFYRNVVTIFYGGDDGFSESNHYEVYVPSAVDIETADLNSDGWLDLIACSYYDSVNKHNDTGLFIFWGSSQGFRHYNSQWLPGMSPLGPVVADFDSDGRLDVFSPHYHGEISRENLPSYLYWNSAKGFTSRGRKTLINDSASGGFAADFNQDGRIDLCMINHTIDGNHSKAMSKILYNGGKRFNNPLKVELLSSPGSHWMWGEDMGHIYTRKWRHVYTSSILHSNALYQNGVLRYDAKIPQGTSLEFEVRGSPSKSGLSKSNWKSIQNGNFHFEIRVGYIQYRAIFISDNGDRYPELDKVTIETK